MSVADKLQTLTENISDAYDAVNTKGGTIPQDKNTENLADAITSIPSGGGGLTSISITNKSAFVNVSLPTNATYAEQAIQVTTDPADGNYFVESSDLEVAKPVYTNGGYSLRFMGPGTATVRVYSGSVSDSMTVTTTLATTSITMNNLPAFSEVGTTYQASIAQWQPANSKNNGVSWSSNDSTIASIGADTGLLTFNAVGSYTATATVNGYPSVKASKTASVITKETDPDFDAIHQMIQAGTAEAAYPIGSEFNTKYSENGGTTQYTMPWIVMRHDPAVPVKINGVETTVPGIWIMPKYTNLTSQRYSLALQASNQNFWSLTSTSGETTAQDGFYYYTNSNVPLNLQPGDLLDFGLYPTIYKSTYNVDTATKFNNLRSYGDKRWEVSNARTYLNNTYISFFNTSFTNHLAEVKVDTVYSAYEYPDYTAGTKVTTYDKFFCPSNVEVHAGLVDGTNYTQAQVDGEGTDLPYWAQASGQANPNYSQTDLNNVRRKAAINQQTSYQNYWLRSVYSSRAGGEWFVGSGGNVYGGSAYGSYRLAPLAVLI